MSRHGSIGRLVGLVVACGCTAALLGSGPGGAVATIGAGQAENPQASASETVAQAAPAEAQEIIGLRTENSRTFRLADGQHRTDVYSNDVFFRTPVGNLVPIDNSLTEVSERPAYRFKNKANSWTALFGDNLGPEAGVQIEKGDCLVSFKLMGESPDSRVAKGSSLRGSAAAVDQELAEDNRTVVYRAVLPDVDIAYTVLTNGLKEDIVLRSERTPSTFVLSLELGNLRPAARGNGVSFVDEAGNEVFQVLPVTMQDSSGKYSEAVSFHLEGSAGHYTVTVSADPSFLMAQDTVYPVVIDPTFLTLGSSYTFDSYVSSRYPNTKYATSPYLRTGYDTTYHARRTFIRFRLPSGFRYDGITAATLRLYLHSKGSSPLYTKAYCLDYWPTNFWKSTTVCWNDQPTVTHSGHPASVSGNHYTFSVYAAVKENYHLTHDNLGWCVRDDYESNPNIWGTFYSSDSGGSYLPVLSITHGAIAGYKVLPGNWPAGEEDDLRIWLRYGGETDALYGDEIAAVYQRWNGIPGSTANIDGIDKTSSPSGQQIQIYSDYLSPGELAYVVYFDENDEIMLDWETFDGTWNYTWMVINSDPSSLMYRAKDDIQYEVIVHELGHCIGLGHLYEERPDSTVSIMSNLGFYCYPYPTDHDRQAVAQKY